jgi:16S rRNA (guanine527-N7)-methyltransferase
LIFESYFPGLTARQMEQFAALEPLYAEWNARINVVSRKEMASGEFFTRHVLHSLAIARACEFSAGNRVVDVGTGGGFPAIPLAIMFPEVDFVAVDSIAKKIRVVDEIARAVGLTNLTTVCGRAENLPARRSDGTSSSSLSSPSSSTPASTPTPAFDWAVSRAVAPAATVLDWVWSRVSRGVLLLKGGDLADELAATGRNYVSHNIADWFAEPFFETKKVIFVPKP